MKIAAVQLSSTDDVDHNLATIDRLVGQCAADGASLVSLPENCVLMPRKPADLVRCAEQLGTHINESLADIARRHQVFLLAGSVPQPSADAHRILATSGAYDQTGAVVGEYCKVHLFDVQVGPDEAYRESDYTSHGSQLTVVESPLGGIGLSICYDMRFPEMYRVLGQKDVALLNIPSAFTVPTGHAHWEVLLRARAVENLCFVIAAAQVGVHPSGRETYGHSIIIDPWGVVLGCLPEGEGFVLADVDVATMHNARKRFPALTHRRIGDGGWIYD